MSPFEATYYDGTSTQAHPVLVWVDVNGAIHLRGEGIELSFQPSELKISPRLGDTSRSIVLPDEQQIETEDNDAVDGLARHAKAQGGRWVHRLERSWPIALLSLAAAGLFAVGGVVWGVPLLAGWAAHRIPAEVAHGLGEDTLAFLDEALFDPSELSPEARASAEEVFGRVAASHPELPLRLEFRAMGLPNAFALPDGTVILTDELLELDLEEGELLAVLAHEAGHVYHRHGLRTVLENSSLAILVGVYLGDFGSAASTLASLPVFFSRAAYSRAHETEADSFALDLLRREGVAERHFATLMRKLSESAGDDPHGALQYLSSHPPTEERIARVSGAWEPTQEASE